MPKKKTKKTIDTHDSDEYSDDVIIEETEEEIGMGDAIKKVKAQLKQCKEERREYLEGWQRAKADFVNAKNEYAERLKQSSQFAKGDLISEILPTLDSFDMAMANKEAWESVDKNWRVGVEYIYTQLLSTLEGNGLKQIDPLGKPFDMHLHTALEEVESDEDDGKVLEVVQKGYMLKDTLLRPAKVKVAKKK